MSGWNWWIFARVKNSINYHPEFGCLCQVKFSTTWKSARSTARRILEASNHENVDSLWTKEISNRHKSSESSLVNFRWNSVSRFNHLTAIVVARMMTPAVTYESFMFLLKKSYRSFGRHATTVTSRNISKLDQLERQGNAGINEIAIIKARR